MKSLRSKSAGKPFSVQVKKELHRLKRKSSLFKFKIFMVVILPAVIILLAMKTAQVWLGIKLRQINVPVAETISPAETATGTEPSVKKPDIKPVQQQIMPNEYITPQPLDTKPV